MGTFMHACEGEMVCTSIHPQGKVPHFNAQMFLENKTVRARPRIFPPPFCRRVHALRFSLARSDGLPRGTAAPL